jgi:single-strand DNA-binding protein
MMKGYNKAIIVGNLARDPEIRYTASQRAVVSFSVAVNRSWKGQDGEVREETTFIPVVIWGKSAEFCERYLKKGSAVLVEGRISVRSYEAKSGEKRYVTEIVADTIQFAGSAGKESRADVLPNVTEKQKKPYAGEFSAKVHDNRQDVEEPCIPF